MDGARVAGIAPSLTLSVAAAERPDERWEVHFHPGGQGFRVARLIARMGAAVVLCAPAALWAGMESLRDRGAARVLLSRADARALVLDGRRRLEVEAPAFETRNPWGRRLDDRGPRRRAGPRAEARGRARSGAAAAALNVTRQGLGTGDAGAIARLAGRLTVREA